MQPSGAEANRFGLVQDHADQHHGIACRPPWPPGTTGFHQAAVERPPRARGIRGPGARRSCAGDVECRRSLVFAGDRQPADQCTWLSRRRICRHRHAVLRDRKCLGTDSRRVLGRVPRAQQLRRPQAASRPLLARRCGPRLRCAGMRPRTGDLAAAERPWRRPRRHGPEVAGTADRRLSAWPHRRSHGGRARGAGSRTSALRFRPHRADQRKRLVAVCRKRASRRRRRTTRKTRTTAPLHSDW